MFGSGATTEVERSEAELCQGAADLNAALCRWLEQLAAFDRAKGYEVAECRSCAHWLNWKCGVAVGEAREQVRVARALKELPVVREAFAGGQLSFSQVRPITRVATADTEAALVELARHGTATHLQQVVRAWRRVAAADEAAAADRQYAERFVRWLWDDDGSLVMRGRLPAEDRAAVVAALQAAADETASGQAQSPLAVDDGTEAEDRGEDEGRPDPAQAAAQRSADALVVLAESFLAHGAESGTGGERVQVVVHVNAATLSDDTGERCELEGGPALAAETARRLGCDASVVAITNGPDGPLDVGRKQRTIPTAMRRALRARDGGCQFPGCTEVRFVDGHHIHHWGQGGPTRLDNLVEVCRRHHRALHEGRWRITVGGTGLRFTHLDGRVLKAGPVGARGDPNRPGGQNRQLGLDVGADTCVPRWAGERLDLGLAIDALACLRGIHKLE